MARADRARRLPPGLGWLLLLVVLALGAAGLLASAAVVDMHEKRAAVEAAMTPDQFAHAAAALTDARQFWRSTMVGLLAVAVLLAFLQIVRMARHPVPGPDDSLSTSPDAAAGGFEGTSETRRFHDCG